jgi:hypothetical protein
MSVVQSLVGIVVLAASSVASAQTTEAKPPDSGSRGDTSSLSSSMAASARRNKAKGLDQAEILTDTMGVDFGPYLMQAKPIVRKN